MNREFGSDQEWSQSWQQSCEDDDGPGQTSHQYTRRPHPAGSQEGREQTGDGQMPRWLPRYDAETLNTRQPTQALNSSAYQTSPDSCREFHVSSSLQFRSQTYPSGLSFATPNSVTEPIETAPSQASSTNWLPTQFGQLSISSPVLPPSQHVRVTRTRQTSQEHVPYAYTTPAIIQSGQDVSEDEQKLYASFKRNPRPRRFFTTGKVFLTLWAEPAGDSTSSVGSAFTAGASGVSVGSYGERVFSKIRRFIVVREGTDSCTALPIKTYGGEGVSKKGVRKREHAIIFTGKHAPAPHPKEAPSRGERGLLPQPIRVDGDSPDSKLDAMSRIDFGKVYTIEHNVKVSSMGKVNRASEGPLLYQLKVVWEATMGNPPMRESDMQRAPAGTIESQASHTVLEWIDAYNTLIASGWTDARARSVLKSTASSNTEQSTRIPPEQNTGLTDVSKRSSNGAARPTVNEEQPESQEQDQLGKAT